MSLSYCSTDYLITAKDNSYKNSKNNRYNNNTDNRSRYNNRNYNNNSNNERRRACYECGLKDHVYADWQYRLGALVPPGKICAGYNAGTCNWRWHNGSNTCPQMHICSYCRRPRERHTRTQCKHSNNPDRNP